MAKKPRTRKAPTQARSRIKRAAAPLAQSTRRKNGEKVTRAFEIERASLNREARSVEVSFSSETNGVRFGGIPQILVHEDKTVNLRSLRSGSVLFHHRPEKILGRPSNIRLDKEKRMGRATIIFDDDDEGERMLRKVESGSLQGVSAGAKVAEWVFLERGQEWQSPEGRTFRGPADLATKWAPVEISLTPIPADSEVGVGRTLEGDNAVKITKKLRTFLVERGMPDCATDAEATKFLEGLSDDMVTRTELKEVLEAHKTELERAKKPEPKKDVKRADPPSIDDAISAERQRQSDIRNLCRAKAGEGDELQRKLDAIADKHLAQDSSIDLVRGEVLDAVRESRPPLERGARSVEYGEDASDKLARAAECHLEHRVGLIRDGVKDHEDRMKLAREVDAFSLFDLARLCLRTANAYGPGMSRSDIIQRAFSHTGSNYPSILENVMNKSLQQGWTEAPSTWEAVARTASVSDFKSVSRPKLGDSGDLLETASGAPMPEMSVPEAKETYSIATYSRRFGLTRQTIIDDDLDALSTIPARMGAAARRLPNKLFWDLLISGTDSNGPIMAEDSEQLFSLAGARASGANYRTGATVLVDVTGLGFGRLDLRKVVGYVATGETAPTLNLLPEILVVPPELEGKALQLLTDTTPATIANVNPAWTRNLQLVVEPRLSAATDGATAWYLVSRQAEGAEVAFLNGDTTPTPLRVEGTNILGIEWGLYLDCGAKFIEHRGWWRAKGAA